ncbi:MAG: NUDIX domain-containing protein [Actinobacteria bacterium]|nr:NUDIX domain-containing protein [Actinomycetota bacterium]
MPSVSAGLLLYRWGGAPETDGRRLEVLLVHPGGPYWAKKDAGAWSIPKGEAEADELGPAPPTVTAAKARNRAADVDLLAVAQREVKEETGLEPKGPYQPLGGVKAHHHKLIYAWAVEYDCDPAAIVSNAFAIEWPPRSGRRAEFPEVDRAAWFGLVAAREAILPAQRRFIDDLEIVAGRV